MMSKSKSRVLIFMLMVLAVMITLSACGQKASTETEASASGSAEPTTTTVKLVTNWFAQAEHGGYYAALDQNLYKDAGLEMTIQPGGPEVSATQIVASGQAQFGMASADEILLARQNGIPLVAIMTTFQKSPQILITHKNQNITDMNGINNHPVYVASGSVFWEYLKAAYKLDSTKDLAYTGSLAPFIADDTAVIQGYVTSEPYELKKQNVDINALSIADAGFNPYANLIFTTEDYIKEHPDTVKAFVASSIKGWEYYKDHAEDVNPVIHKSNPDLPLENMKYAAEAELPLIFEEDATANGMGYMSKERWDELAKQMTDLGILTSAPDTSKAFTTEFLPAT